MLINFRIDCENRAQIIQPVEGPMYKLYLQNGTIWCQQASREVIGNWDEVIWTEPEQVFTERDIIDFQVSMSEGEYFLLVYTMSNGTNKVAIWPGEFPLYGNKDPYRIYWGTDSHILYMNVENTWVPVSTMNPDGTAGTVDYYRKEW